MRRALFTSHAPRIATPKPRRSVSPCGTTGFSSARQPGRVALTGERHTPRDAHTRAPTVAAGMHLAPIARDTRHPQHAHTAPRATRPAHALARTRAHAHPHHAPRTRTPAGTHHAHPATCTRTPAHTRGPPPPPTPSPPARKRSASRGARGSGGFMLRAPMGALSRRESFPRPPGPRVSTCRHGGSRWQFNPVLRASY